jgi:hypothetical protein
VPGSKASSASEFDDLPSRHPDASSDYCELTHCVVSEPAYAATARLSARIKGFAQRDHRVPPKRDDFLLELGQTLGGQGSVRPVDSLEGALEAMAQGKRGQLLVIDARDVADVRDAVDAAHAAAPSVVVLVFAAGAAEQQLGTSLGGSNVFAVLPLPLDPRKTQAVVEGALAEAVARCAPAPPAASPLSSQLFELSVDTFEPQPAAVSERSGRGRKPPVLVFVAAGVTVLRWLAVPPGISAVAATPPHRHQHPSRTYPPARPRVPRSRLQRPPKLGSQRRAPKR